MMNSLDDWDKQDLNLWRNLFSDYSVVQAALLIVGVSPSKNKYILTDSPDFRPFGFDAAFMALKQEILNKNSFKAKIRREAHERGWDEEQENGSRFTKDISFYNEWEKGATLENNDQADFTNTLRTAIDIQIRGVIYRIEPDWELTTITKENLIKWLEERNIKPAFFFSEKMGAQKEQSNLKPDCIDKDHPRYSMRLHAAVSAWEAMRDESLTKNKNPKDAMTDWIQENFKDLSSNAAKEAAAIANWFKDGLNNKKE